MCTQVTDIHKMQSTTAPRYSRKIVHILASDEPHPPPFSQSEQIFLSDPKLMDNLMFSSVKPAVLTKAFRVEVEQLWRIFSVPFLSGGQDVLFTEAEEPDPAVRGLLLDLV